MKFLKKNYLIDIYPTGECRLTNNHPLRRCSQLRTFMEDFEEQYRDVCGTKISTKILINFAVQQDFAGLVKSTNQERLMGVKNMRGKKVAVILS